MPFFRFSRCGAKNLLYKTNKTGEGVVMVTTFSLRFLMYLLWIFVAPFVLSHAQAQTVSTDEVRRIAQEIYANESFVRVRGSASVQAQTSGSSMVVEYQEKKYILTNFHVVQTMVDIYVEDLKTGNMYPSRVIGRDPLLDLALLTLPKELEHLSHVPFAHATVGEMVFAIGFPFGVRNVTNGIVTSEELVGAMFLLSQVPLNPGNSGGPLLNMQQQVVGVNTAYRPNANLYSFSIPSSYVQKILPQLVEGGAIRHANAKLAVTDLRNLLPRNFSEMGIPFPMKRPGVVVIAFQDDAAAQQGIDIGDVIITIDGVGTTTIGEYLERLLFFYKSGQKAKFTLLRGTEELQVEIKLSSHPDPK